jgi:hypothetical protein
MVARASMTSGIAAMRVRVMFAGFMMSSKVRRLRCGCLVWALGGRRRW